MPPKYQTQRPRPLTLPLFLELFFRDVLTIDQLKPSKWLWMKVKGTAKLLGLLFSTSSAFLHPGVRRSSGSPGREVAREAEVLRSDDWAMQGPSSTS